MQLPEPVPQPGPIPVEDPPPNDFPPVDIPPEREPPDVPVLGRHSAQR